MDVQLTKSQIRMKGERDMNVVQQLLSRTVSAVTGHNVVVIDNTNDEYLVHSLTSNKVLFVGWAYGTLAGYALDEEDTYKAILHEFIQVTDVSNPDLRRKPINVEVKMNMQNRLQDAIQKLYDQQLIDVEVIHYVEHAYVKVLKRPTANTSCITRWELREMLENEYYILVEDYTR